MESAMLITVMSDIRANIRLTTATCAGRLSYVVDKVSKAVAEAVLNAGVVLRPSSCLVPVRVPARVPVKAH